MSKKPHSADYFGDTRDFWWNRDFLALMSARWNLGAVKRILDVGCGRELNLVNYLRDNGYEAYGIDRFNNNNPYYSKCDWLEHNFEPSKWGTIISNLGFSNHFIHHNLRVDGNFREYAQKYMEILASLKPNGSFHYAPDLPFIESHVNKQTYRVTNSVVENSEFKASRITRIS